ncbi:MAG: class I SAM-dependent RNA methyltransferase [Candidatus Omnitrophica bacterium]|nr:class I SAM-dependent RNA methyltransferase [Candidatus Omnitrophota bacterium]
MDLERKNTVLVTCANGLMPYLAQEVERLGFIILSRHNTGLTIKAALRDTFKLNLYLRTAYNVLYLLGEFNAETPEELYGQVSALAWEDIIDIDEYINVVAQTNTSSIRNPVFASQKTKDAIVDRLFKKYSRRPDSGIKRTNIVIHLYWKDNRCWLYLNTSGQKLADRNYRKNPHKAPIQETLAASLVMATGYSGQEPFINPMCGSGTLAIEAALIALNRAAGALRGNFGFMHLKGFDAKVWQAMRKEAQKISKKVLKAPILATDIDKQAIEAARSNAMTAGVDRFIEFKVCDFSQTPIPLNKGIIILNPEYGIRMGSVRELEETYEKIGDFFKQKCVGLTAYIFTANMELAKKVGLRTSKRLQFFNAQIECRLLKYEMYQGSKNLT